MGERKHRPHFWQLLPTQGDPSLSAKLLVASYKSTSSSSPFPVPVVFASLDSSTASCALDKHTRSLTVKNPFYSRLTEIQKFRETQCPNHLMLSANTCCRFFKIILFSLKKGSTCPDTLREIRGQLRGNQSSPSTVGVSGIELSLLDLVTRAFAC